MNYKTVVLRSFGLLFLGVCSLFVQAQDTLKLTVPGAETLFLQKNLSLLAAQYTINATQALELQAKTWDNPVLNTDQNLYDGKFFRHSKGTSSIPESGGQIYLSLQQVILTAGKRNKLVRVAQDNTKTSEAQFNELVRNLHFVLVTDLNNLSRLQAIENLLQEQIVHIQTLSKGMDEMLKIGDISQKEDLRIKALLFSMQSEYADNLIEQQDLQKELRTLLQLKEDQVVHVPLSQIDEQGLRSLNLAYLLDTARANRPDIAIVTSQLASQQHNYTYQKALAVPDLTVGVEYDKATSYVKNYYGLQLSLPLPVFNRNRGNIISAGWNVKQAQTLVEQSNKQVQNEVLAAYNKLLTLLSVQKSAKGEWSADYDRLLQNMIGSYQQRKVNLIDFIDFFSSYTETRQKQMKQQADLLNAAAELNFVTNQNLIPIK